jgi:glutamyl-tRNA synthetase
LALQNDTELKELIRKAALLNAVSHDGKAQAGAIVGKILGERQDLRTRAKELSNVISLLVDEVNKLALAEQKTIVERSWPETQKKEKAEERHLPKLPNVDLYPQIVTRFSPNPDCVLHLGSARAIILSHEYARIYKGKFILRFEDTDPKVKKPSLVFYDSIRQDLKWLGCSADEEYIQSDRLPIYYEYTERLIRDGNAYVCECLPQEFRRLTVAQENCSCRILSATENLERWEHMLSGGYSEGQAVVRVKTDLCHPNPAVRDWPALRVIDAKKYPHPRVKSKYVVWPLYNLAAGLDDHLMGITHIIRGKEHYTNMVRQKYMYEHLGWKYPEAIHYGRLKITGAFLSKSKIVQGIKDSVYSGFDDPRLGTFAALRKRGITPEAIRKMIIDIGPKTNDVTLSWDNLYAYNRKILDATSDRYFFVPEPIELEVLQIAKTFHAKLRLHPEKPECGFREYDVQPVGNDKAVVFWIAQQDSELMETGKIVRLMELFNVKIEEKIGNLLTAKFESESYESARKIKAPLIQWIMKGKEYQSEVIMPDTSVAKGYAESACKKLEPDAVVQFERFGFVRVDEVKQKLVAYYAHK